MGGPEEPYTRNLTLEGPKFSCMIYWQWEWLIQFGKSPMGVIWVNIEGGVFSALQGGQAPEVTAGTCQLVRRTIGNLHRIIFCTFCRRSGSEWEVANICEQYWTSFYVFEKSKVIKLRQRFISFVTAWCAMAYQKECLQNVIMWLQILCKIKQTENLHYINTVHQVYTWKLSRTQCHAFL